jgi:cobalt-precorrin 5A hydrolase
MASDNRDLQGTAILSLTRKASELGWKLAHSMGECTLYIPSRLKGHELTSDELHYFDEWVSAFQEAFNSHSRIICIMAAGIVVRSLAPLLVSKYMDPAIVVVDEKGQYAISLLSGHIGGANQLASEVASILGGQVVITTATDVQGKAAADLMARDMDAIIEPRENLKIINRNLAEEQKVYMYSPWPIITEMKQGFGWQAWPWSSQASGEGGFSDQELTGKALLQPAVIISHHRKLALNISDYILIKPRNLAVGIGCRRGINYVDLHSALNEIADHFNIDKRCIKYLASIDIKADEAAIKQLALEMKIPFLTYSSEDILSLEGTYQESAWVKETLGVGGVCEPVACLAAKQGITLVPKQKIGPITISIAMERSWWWDWAPEAETI